MEETEIQSAIGKQVTLEYENGKYVGSVNQENEKHGNGTYYWEDGDYYEGN